MTVSVCPFLRKMTVVAVEPTESGLAAASMEAKSSVTVSFASV